MTVTTEPGDLLWLPVGWFHATLNLEDTVAIGGQLSAAQRTMQRPVKPGGPDPGRSSAGEGRAAAMVRMRVSEAELRGLYARFPRSGLFAAQLGELEYAASSASPSASVAGGGTSATQYANARAAAEALFVRAASLEPTSFKHLSNACNLQLLSRDDVAGARRSALAGLALARDLTSRSKRWCSGRDAVYALSFVADGFYQYGLKMIPPPDTPPGTVGAAESLELGQQALAVVAELLDGAAALGKLDKVAQRSLQVARDVLRVTTPGAGNA